MQGGELCRRELTPPQIDGLCGGFLGRSGAGPAALGEHQNARSGVARVGLAGDVPALHEIFDELAGCLLGDPEVRGNIGRRRVATADPYEREAVGGTDVVEAAPGHAFLDPVNELAGQAQHGGRGLPAVEVHVLDVDILVKKLDYNDNLLVYLEVNMPVIRAAEAAPFEIYGSRFLSYVAPSRGSDQLCAWRLDVPAGLQGVAHRPTREEVLFVLDGELQVTLDGVRSDLRHGDVALVPANSEVRVDAGPDGATAWVTTTPGIEAVNGDGSRIIPPWAQ